MNLDSEIRYFCDLGSFTQILSASVLCPVKWGEVDTALFRGVNQLTGVKHLRQRLGCSQRWINAGGRLDSTWWACGAPGPPEPAPRRGRSAVTWPSQDGVAELPVAPGPHLLAGVLRCMVAGASRPSGEAAATGDLAWDGWVREGGRRRSTGFGGSLPLPAWVRVCKVQGLGARTTVTRHRAGRFRIWGLVCIGKGEVGRAVFWRALVKGCALR